MDEDLTCLKVVPSLRARYMPDGSIRLTQKFIAGIQEFQRYWGGPVAVYLEADKNDTTDLDGKTVRPGDLSFDLRVLSLPEIEDAVASDDSAVVLLSLDDFTQTALWKICRERRIVCSYISEYTLETRNQNIDLNTKNPLKRLRRKMWETSEERKRQAAVVGASGLQCNGTPTFNAYHHLCPDALLYFDSRITEDLLACEQDIQRDRQSFAEIRPLQLFFSGRLIPMKGVEDLIDVAKALRRLNAAFHLSICGDGELKPVLARSIERENLNEYITLKGTLDFRDELVPFVKADIDLFVCCHPQGDPSCTYLETMSCGVPIVGYSNEALAGIVQRSESGWTVPLHASEELAKQIIRIGQDPQLLLKHSIAALNFAAEHTFEKTFSRRIDHLRALSFRDTQDRTNSSLPLKSDAPVAL